MKHIAGGLLLSILAVTLPAAAGHASGPASLNGTLTPYLAKYALPAFAAAVTRAGTVVAAGAVGLRRADAALPVTLDDRFHIGSDTKAMTALLAAMLVEAGRLRWDSTPAELFPELSGQMDARLRSVTLTQLLSHTSGIPADNEAIFAAYGEAMLQEGNLDELRYGLLKRWCGQPLAAEPGATFAYANMGYIFVGAMIERVTGRTWEETITERLFLPLQMKTAGLGPQGSLGRTDAAIPHRIVAGKPKPMLAGPNGDAPAIVGPAGIAHMSVLDFARWADWNAGEGKRGPALVSPVTLRRLHTPVITMPSKRDAPPGTPPGGDYALGWGRLAMDWAPYPLLYHGGSNGMNLAHIWLDPQRDLAIVTMTNVGGPGADQALHALVRELYKSYGRP